ncbi:MAG: winged helix-turn-helix transcriptional regulator [Trueperaceae bacterium]|nr:winged helix-turn-helix transcriptional regulator [Trueperaceae bacterium]
MHDDLHEFKADFFKALGNPLRLRILDALRDHEKSVSMLQDELAVEQSTLSQQLSILAKKGFIVSRKEGTLNFYRVKDPDVYRLLDLGRTLFERHLQSSQRLLDALSSVEPRNK